MAYGPSMEEMKLNDSLLQQLECPICTETCKPPIFMCLNGHNVCSSCHVKITDCPVCRAPGRPKGHNIFAETASAKILIPCKFQKAGCKVKKNTKDMKEHYSVCKFSYQCMVTARSGVKCVFTGNYSTLVKHVEDKHQSNIGILDKEFTAYFDRGIDNHHLLLYEWNDKLFWFHREYTEVNEECLFYLQCVDTKEEASAFDMVLTISSMNGRSILVFHRLALGLEEPATNMNSVTLTKDTLNMITQGELAINYRLSITTVWDR